MMVSEMAEGRRVEGERFPLNENVAGKPAELPSRPIPEGHGEPTAAMAEKPMMSDLRLAIIEDGD